MTSEFDELQELILEDARKIYSEKTIDHFMKPRNLGDMEDADGFGRVAGSCGDTMEIWLKVKNGTIANATCPSGSRYTEGSNKRLPNDGEEAAEKGLPQTLRRRISNATHSFNHR